MTVSLKEASRGDNKPYANNSFKCLYVYSLACYSQMSISFSCFYTCLSVTWPIPTCFVNYFTWPIFQNLYFYICINRCISCQLFYSLAIYHTYYLECINTYSWLIRSCLLGYSMFCKLLLTNKKLLLDRYQQLYPLLYLAILHIPLHTKLLNHTYLLTYLTSTYYRWMPIKGWTVWTSIHLLAFLGRVE